MPKALWKKLVQTDYRNRIELALNSLLIRSDNKNILIDTGLGDVISDKVNKYIHLQNSFYWTHLKKLDLPEMTLIM